MTPAPIACAKPALQPVLPHSLPLGSRVALKEAQLARLPDLDQPFTGLGRLGPLLFEIGQRDCSSWLCWQPRADKESSRRRRLRNQLNDTIADALISSDIVMSVANFLGGDALDAIPDEEALRIEESVVAPAQVGVRGDAA